ncbi:hypothetical protein LTR48_000541 [Friedmanniomyces endolithicus]|uniref:Uncharacterized protein n=1 Tax=Rachicladosporium monterosium TaxID=1507873 RepID=A0ABR0L418_9PEZI|nr:hypothetical protein LTR29_011718 [Friedmanniomyces endolithicus]KAK1094342.1 hypothetical protein LTR48_000541 [Friedmanniomyces endolithicus]KAK1815928.1 hypothetical protein LTR12_009713 [Friedmanniomyces endolithicus]KAK5142254.1 hypothetical protein LTR32_005366 [Rachicladosporium monterosium]
MSRIEFLLVRAREAAARLEFTNVTGPAAGASVDENAGRSTTPDHRPKVVHLRGSLMNDLNHALATGQREIEELHVRLDDQEGKSTAQAQKFKKLEDELATLCVEISDD